MEYIIVSILGIIIAGSYLYLNHIYRKTDYGKHHKENLIQMINNAGAYGEYETSLLLENFKCYKKTLYNCYLPKNEKETTEIDIIAITEYGIWIIENKNYHGNVYGDSSSTHWCQFVGKKKSFFYNPIFQNATHIRALKNIITMYPDNFFQSIIVFNQAKIKIKNFNNNTHVFEKAQFINFIGQQHNKILTTTEINNIYNMLMPYTQVTKEQKKKHIENIDRKYKSNTYK